MNVLKEERRGIELKWWVKTDKYDGARERVEHGEEEK